VKALVSGIPADFKEDVSVRRTWRTMEEYVKVHVCLREEFFILEPSTIEGYSEFWLVVRRCSRL